VPPKPSVTVCLAQESRQLGLKLRVSRVDGGAQRALSALPFTEPLQDQRQIAQIVGVSYVLTRDECLSVGDHRLARRILRPITFKLVERDIVPGRKQRCQAVSIRRAGLWLFQLRDAFIQPGRATSLGDLVDERMRELVFQRPGKFGINLRDAADGHTQLAVVKCSGPCWRPGHIEILLFGIEDHLDAFARGVIQVADQVVLVLLQHC
jgi:hypothetical protein